MMKKILTTALISLSLLGLTACSDDDNDNNSNANTAATIAELAMYQAEEARITKNLKTFDTLDFEIFTGQDWDRLHESHSEDILVHWPDGREAVGLSQHIADLQSFFVYAPDTRIETHPIRIGQGEWTGVVGVIEGTFTQPMPLANGEFIQPTGLAYKLTMATIGHWNDEGVMDEEYLFWDNQAFMQQIGLAE